MLERVTIITKPRPMEFVVAFVTSTRTCYYMVVIPLVLFFALFTKSDAKLCFGELLDVLAHQPVAIYNRVP